jgi:hypothetical protein
MTELTTNDSTTTQVVEFLSKGYTDEDCFHILPHLTESALLEIKNSHAESILRGMRDYYLVSKFNDDAMDRIEAMALEKLEMALSLEVDPVKILKVFQTVNAAKRRSLGEGQSAGNTTIVKEQKVVQIQMPARMLEHTAKDFETNKNNEVIRVGNTHMVTATNTQVLEQLKEHKKSAIEEAYDGV